MLETGLALKGSLSQTVHLGRSGLSRFRQRFRVYPESGAGQSRIIEADLMTSQVYGKSFYIILFILEGCLGVCFKFSSNAFPGAGRSTGQGLGMIRMTVYRPYVAVGVD